MIWRCWNWAITVSKRKCNGKFYHVYVELRAEYLPFSNKKMHAAYRECQTLVAHSESLIPYSNSSKVNATAHFYEKYSFLFNILK